ncbi:MAG TPA: hypothetical protein VKU39_02370, partial [Streptosporangiaceae bacterium]|nr:hypothetical protein [Streptosporangiaceae bacterium]
LPARAVRRLRRRKAAICAAVGASLTAVTAVAITLAAAGPVTDQRTSYVLLRAEAALAAVSQQDLIQQIHVTFAVGESASDWLYGSQDRLLSYGPDGRPTSDDGDRVVGNQAISTGVDYSKKTWYQSAETMHGGAPSAIPPPCAEVARLAYNMPIPGPPDWANEFSTALSCGVYQVAGTEQVNGKSLIRLTPAHPGNANTTYWIDAATYLPVRAQLAYGDSRDEETFQWLSPTAANLAHLNVPIPAGFTRVPPPS